MIPWLQPSLTGLGVLVTRPATQADGLCQRLAALGADTYRWPALNIVPLAHEIPDERFDLIIFVSANAVAQAGSLLTHQPQARIAAVGPATAQALAAQGQALDITPDSIANSEALLAHPLLMTPPAKVLIVRGQGGRELLRDTLSERGAEVTVLEVYTREVAAIDTPPQQALSNTLATALAEIAVQVVTITSIDILQALRTQGVFPQLQHLAALAGSLRIAEAVRAAGWQGECVIARSPMDHELLDALIRWHSRQRMSLHLPRA